VATASDISWSGPAGTFNLRVAAVISRWVPVRELGSVDFRPAGLIPILPELTDTLRHVALDRTTP
jgi:hypothetical protein